MRHKRRARISREVAAVLIVLGALAWGHHLAGEVGVTRANTGCPEDTDMFGTQYTSGDCHITSNTDWGNGTYYLAGNLHIASGVILRLFNLHVYFDPTHEHEFRLQLNGAKLITRGGTLSSNNSAYHWYLDASSSTDNQIDMDRTNISYAGTQAGGTNDGGITLRGGGPFYFRNLDVSNSQLTNAYWGGFIHCESGEPYVGDLVLEDSSFDNVPWRILRWNPGSCQQPDSFWINNITVTRGGLEWLENPSITVESNAVISDVEFKGNVSGVIKVFGGNVTIRNVHVWGIGQFDREMILQGTHLQTLYNSVHNVTIEGMTVGNMSSSGTAINLDNSDFNYIIDNVTIRDSHFANITSNGGGANENIWIIGLYSGDTLNPGTKVNKNIRITKNTFIQGPDTYGHPGHDIATGCVCGNPYEMPWELWIDNNTFDRSKSGVPGALASNFGSNWIDSTIENNTFVFGTGTQHQGVWRGQNTRGTSYVRSNTVLVTGPVVNQGPYRYNLSYGVYSPTIVFQDEFIRSDVVWEIDPNGDHPTVIFRDNRYDWLNETARVYDIPSSEFQGSVLGLGLSRTYVLDGTRWSSPTMAFRYQGMSMEAPQGDHWMNITMNRWTPSEAIVAEWSAELTSDKTTWLNLTGLGNALPYSLHVDGVEHLTATSDSQGRLSIPWSGWSKHDFIVVAEEWTNTAPSIQNRTSVDLATVATAYSRRVEALDPNSNQTLSWSVETNATFLRLEGSNRTAWLNGTPEGTGPVYVNLKVVDQGCDGSCSLGSHYNYTLLVEAVPVDGDGGGQNASFEATLTSEMLTEDVVQFHAKVEPLGNYAYQWEFGDGEVSSESSPIHRYRYFFFTVVTVQLTVCSDSECRLATHQMMLIKWSDLIVVSLLALYVFLALYTVQKLREIERRSLPLRTKMSGESRR